MITALIILGGVGLTASAILVIAFKFIAPSVDERIEKIAELLPGANCGGCGYPGCQGFAEALVQGKANLCSCAPGGSDCVAQIAQILGVKAVEVEPEVAMVLCAGDRRKAKEKYLYDGVKTCKAASMIAGGAKMCPDGCLGYGDCVRACVFDAMRISPDGVAVVDIDKCTGCGKCVGACPKSIIKLFPRHQKVFILCSSKLPAKEVRKFCSVGCIGCKLCTKESDKIKMDGTLAVIDEKVGKDYEFPESTPLVCLPGAILDTRVYSPIEWIENPRKREDLKKRQKQYKEEKKKMRAQKKSGKREDGRHKVIQSNKEQEKKKVETNSDGN